MSDSKMFFSFKRDLHDVSVMLNLVKNRNNLNLVSKEKENSYSKMRIAYLQIMNAVSEFSHSFPEEENVAASKVFNIMLSNNLKRLNEENAEYLEMHKKVGKYSFEIEKFLDRIAAKTENYRTLRFKTTELTVESFLVQILAVLLIVNFHDHTITEDCFFDDKDEFFSVLEKSENPFIRKLYEEGLIVGNSITENTNIYDFLELY